MELAGLTKATPNPPGGEILKDAQGRPTGALRETAIGIVSRARDESRNRRPAQEAEAEERRVVQLAVEECLSKGITSLHDAGVPFETVELYGRLARERRLGVRLYVLVREAPERLAQGLASHRVIGAENGFLTVRAIKVSLDGALGSRGAWLLEPYSDQPALSGLNTVTIAALEETARLALANGYQVGVHAIGDRANRETLDVYEQAFRGRAKEDLRWRIEHAQHLHPADIPRFGKLGVIASMQGIHCTSDAPFVIARLGRKRAEEGAYVWRKLLKSGAVIANGTDAPVEDVDPIASFHASVTRRLKDGSLFFPDQRMTRMEALRSYTLDAAYAAFEEKEKGSLEPGKLADVTVLSKDILTVPEDQIRSARVAYTIVGGKVSFRRQ
jgi:predicted amidohydrolase YtcJ